MSEVIATITTSVDGCITGLASSYLQPTFIVDTLELGGRVLASNDGEASTVGFSDRRVFGGVHIGFGLQ